MTLSRARALSRQRLLVQQDADALRRAAPDAPAQLVQLREPDALGVLDHHQRRVGHVDADFDHRGRDQQLDRRRARKRSITAAFSAGFSRPCTRPDLELGQASRSAPRAGLDRGLQLAASPIPRSAGRPSRPGRPAAQASRTRSTTSSRRALGDELGHDRRAARRQLVDHRHVEIGVVAHRQRARDRRRAHHQLVRLSPHAALPAAARGAARRRSDAARRRSPAPACGSSTSSWNSACVPIASCASPLAIAAIALAALLRRQAAGEPRDLARRSGSSQARELAVVLLGEDFGRRHDRDLIAVLDRLQRGERGDDGLAAADVALQQALHRVGALRDRARISRMHALLRARQRERQRARAARRVSVPSPGSARRARARARAAMRLASTAAARAARRT